MFWVASSDEAQSKIDYPFCKSASSLREAARKRTTGARVTLVWVLDNRKHGLLIPSLPRADPLGSTLLFWPMT